MENEKPHLRQVDRILKDIYYDVKYPASFGGIANLSKASNLSQQETRRWLEGQDTDSYKYSDVLDNVLNSYNNTVHSITGFAPAKVREQDESLIFHKLYGSKNKIKYKFNIGDQVRISKTVKTFRRGYLPNWSEEIFTIRKRFPSNPLTYILEDIEHEILRGRFYEPELQKVTKKANAFWRIEKILKTRGKGKEKEHFVKWKGFDNRFNSWIKAEWMK
ncbi:uncharacterized transposon-derived protein F54H12.3 [Nephila pilipes]|uniref:Uncharacterized transposon-derived protein F54H12.3 n=1 Tax=Nephila pilipes TaxID=299642 RepID=A0A8X6R140_NEPPI|nr:uncharacterized transposon-derived protein F54H12.3 [Nephila pilipes]